MDWYSDFANAIVKKQKADGGWPDFSDYPDAEGIPRTLTTAWALLTLETVTPHLARRVPVGGFLTILMRKQGNEDA